VSAVSIAAAIGWYCCKNCYHCTANAVLPYIHSSATAAMMCPPAVVAPEEQRVVH
jgi:hypothetical protein